jgi:CheY-like chemotaxis protein
MRSLRILLAEDQADSAFVLQRLLTIEGHRVALAHSVADALSRAAAMPFDLLLSDLTLPDGTGFELMQQLCQISPLRGIAVTGHDASEVQHQCLAAGFNECLVKPVSMALLNAAIARVLEHEPCPQ